MPDTDTGERVTRVVGLPSRDGVHRHSSGAYVAVIDGSATLGLGGREPVVLKAGDGEDPTVEDA